MKQMKLKKNKKKSSKKKWYIFLLCTAMVLTFCYEAMMHLEFNISNEEFIRRLLQDGNHHNNSVQTSNNVLTEVLQFFSGINFQDATSILQKNYQGLTDLSVDSDQQISLEDASKLSEYIENPYPDKVTTDPLVYIYNTHQLEQYSKSNIESYNVTPNVMMASYILKEKLNDLGISSLVEEQNVTELLQMNNWNYASSYKVTKMLMEDAKEKNPTLKYFVDLHRDSVTKGISTAEINGKNYAKIMFIVGLENPDYEKNLAITNDINERLKKKYPGISRGIYKKEGKGVNGVYNQDVSPNAILIECGGYENTIEEVLNTIEAIAQVLADYIGDNNG